MSDNPSLIGRTLRQRYKIIAQLGSGGGFGETYLAEDLDIPEYPKPRRVIKRLQPTIQNPEIDRLFQSEAETLNKLGKHDRIPTLYAYFESDGEFYLVQELIEGRDLRREMNRQWSESEAFEFLVEILEVLGFVHENGVIHRDIKPGNIMRRDRDRKFMLIDFGAVKQVSTMEVNEGGLASKTIAIGTPGYIPSEQAQGRPRFSSDIYAVGMTAIQALTGVAPMRIQEDAKGAIDWRKHAPHVSEWLANFLTKMVRSQCDRRYANAKQALQALRQGDIEPISALLSWILLKAVIDLMSDRDEIGLNLFQTSIKGFVNYLNQNSQSLNHELQKAVLRSYLKAQYRIAIEYRHQLARSFPTFMQYSPFYSQKQRDDLRWVKQKITKLSAKIKEVDGAEYIENMPEAIASVLSNLPPADDIPKKKEQLLAAAVSNDEILADYAKKLSPENSDLLNLVCANFAKEIEQDRLVRAIFESGLLTAINSQFSDSSFTTQDLENSLLKTTLDLEKFKQQQEEAPTVFSSPPIPADTQKPETQTMFDSTQTESGLQIETPSGQVPINSPFYVERPPIESECYQTIINPGALIRIKAPRQMGKTSLMTRILESARQQNYQTAFLNFQSADSDSLETLDDFLQWFCAIISDELGLPEKVAEYWDSVLNSKRKCTKYFARYLLSKIPIPLVLGLDEVDQIFQHPKIATDFFAMLRTWHEQGKNEDVWQKLRLVIVHSQEVYIPLNINQSPFNVGLPIDLREFYLEEVTNLVRRHQLDWSEEEVQQLMSMMGGHPYLVRVALYQVARRKMSLKNLLQVAPTEEGPYSDHLRRHLYNLQENPELLAAIKQVLAADNPIQIGAIEAFKLRSMGLVNFQGNSVMPMCELYRRYFNDRLGN